MIAYRVTATLGRDKVTVEDGAARAPRASLRRLVEHAIDPLPGPADGDPAEAVVARLRAVFPAIEDVEIERGSLPDPGDGVVF